MIWKLIASVSHKKHGGHILCNDLSYKWACPMGGHVLLEHMPLQEDISCRRKCVMGGHVLRRMCLTGNYILQEYVLWEKLSFIRTYLT